VHTVLEVEGMQVTSVRCRHCGAEGPMRMPRDRAKAALRRMASRGEKPAPRRRKSRSRPSANPAREFRRLIEGRDLSEAKPYDVGLDLVVGGLIEHPRFGLGVVTEMLGADKVNVTFEDGPRRLICKRA